ncbi:MAG: TonB-dependent receptor [Bacteroidetes bacterium]|nr:TonB-dependent receptor [Bacteroidota bacterium]
MFLIDYAYTLILIRRILVCVVFCVFTASVQGQDPSITGQITDSLTNKPLVGAHVIVSNTLITTITNVDGKFQISNLDPGDYVLRASMAGYETRESHVTLTDSKVHTWFVALRRGTNLNPVQFSTGHRPEEAINAPASVDVVTNRDLQSDLSPTTAFSLRNITGLDLAQTGIDRYEITLQGFNDAFSRSPYILINHRKASVASIGVNLHSVMPNLWMNTEKVEIVRGPGSAIYGPWAESGVIHFISKNAFNHPGTTISISGGEHSTLSLQGRVAQVFGNNIGITFTGSYATGEDFPLQECDPAFLEAQRFSQCPDPEDAVHLHREGPRKTGHDKMIISSELDWWIGHQTTLSLSGGVNNLNSNLLTGLGAIRALNFRELFAQVRLMSGPIFVQAYMNSIDSGNSYSYDAGPLIESSKEYTIQGEYSKILKSIQEFTLGVDLKFNRPNTKGTILGRNENIDSIDHYGASLQSVTKISNSLQLTLALRGDYNSVIEKTEVSPRIALVVNPTPSSSLRITYNRSFSSPNAGDFFRDFISTSYDGINVRTLGRTSGFSYARNPDYLEMGSPTSLVASSILPRREGLPTGVGIDAEYLYNLMYMRLVSIPQDELVQLFNEAGTPVPPVLLSLVVQGLNPELTPVRGFIPGALGLVNLSTRSLDLNPRLNDLEEYFPTISPLIAQSWEIGYKAILNNQIRIGIDSYVSRRENFIGALEIITPFVVLPNLRENVLSNIASGIADNPEISNTLSFLGFTPESIAEFLIHLTGDVLPDDETPIAIVQPNENNPGEGALPELVLINPVFGKVQVYGVDVSTQVMASNHLNFFGNASWVSDDFFDHKELDEESESARIALNASSLKFKAGAHYQHASGLSVVAAARYIKGFPVIAGQYIGEIDDYFVLDLGMEYSIPEVGIRIDMGINNTFDSNHREFIGAPRLGRIASIRLTYTTGSMLP